MCGREGGWANGWMIVWLGEWMDEWVSGRTNGWKDGRMDDWMHGWVNVCVGCLLVVDLLGLWRGVKPRKPIGRGPLAWLNLP